MIKEKYTPEYIYNEYITKVEPRIIEIETWVSEGKTPSEIAKELFISNSLLWAMRQNKSFTQLRAVFKYKTAYINNVESALLRRAVGFYVEEEKPIKIKSTYYNKNNKLSTREDIKVIKVQRYVEPDVNAIKFLLINKDPTNYHAESQKPIDNSMEEIIDRASEIVVSVKKTADSLEQTHELAEDKENV